MTRVGRCHVLGGLLAGLVATMGCGGAKRAPPVAPGGDSPAATEAPDSMQQTEEGADEDVGGESEGFAEPPAAAPAPGAAPAPPPARPGAGTTLTDAFDDLDAAAAELQASGNDCARACKALGSMKRARDRICALTGPADTEGRCALANDRVDAAVERVNESCGACGR